MTHVSGQLRQCTVSEECARLLSPPNTLTMALSSSFRDISRRNFGESDRQRIRRDRHRGRVVLRAVCSVQSSYSVPQDKALHTHFSSDTAKPARTQAPPPQHCNLQQAIANWIPDGPRNEGPLRHGDGSSERQGHASSKDHSTLWRRGVEFIPEMTIRFDALIFK